MTRAGRYVAQPGSYRAFIPAPLPPSPPVALDPEAQRLLSDADRALGRLDGVAHVLPNPDLFVAMYVRHEAVLSSQIEGTQSTLEDILQFEIDARGRDYPKDIEEVVNYVAAMRYGLERLKELPLCLRLIREIHGRLLKGTRGGHRTPGEFRKGQNYIGSGEGGLDTATFVPPPVPEMEHALANLEIFLQDTQSLPVLIHCGLAHAQFETIHPFMDGNGRVGRLLITFLLCQQEIMRQPLLYLSYYLKSHRSEYYDRLMAIRNEGNWEGWLKFFLRGVYEVSQAATGTARAILEQRETHRQLIQSRGLSANGLRLLDYLFEQPLVDIRTVENALGCSYVTANTLVEQFEQADLLSEMTGGRRNRRYRYAPYLALFEGLQLPPPLMLEESQTAIQTTYSDISPESQSPTEYPQ